MQTNCESGENTLNIETNEREYVICSNCGEKIYKEDNFYIEDLTESQSEQTMWEDMKNNYSNKVLCQHCFEEDYSYCSGCGELTYNDYITFTENDTQYCENCESNYFYCESCERYFDTDYVEQYNAEHDTEVVCENCFNEYYYECTNCHDIVNRDNGRFDICGEFICENCYEEEEQRQERNAISSYHSSRTIEFLKSTKDSENEKLFFGVEMEIQNKTNEYNNNDIARGIKEKLNKKVFCEYDSSVNNGFEIISQPFTYNYLIENKDKVKKSMEYLTESGMVSDQATCSCGFHIHLSRNAFGNTTEEIENNIDKLTLFFETYKNNIVKIARRNGNHYSYFMGDSENDYKYTKYECLSLEYIKKDKENNCDRYKVVNTTNINTIEIRIFKGTLNFDTFMAIIEFVNNLMQIIRNNETDKISFSKVVNYGKTKYLKPYIKLRQITYDYKCLHDYTNYLNILKSKENKLKDSYYKDLLNIAKMCNEVIVEVVANETYLNDLTHDFCNSDYVVYIISKIKGLMSNQNGMKNCGYSLKQMKSLNSGYLSKIISYMETIQMKYGIDTTQVINEIKKVGV